MKRNWKKPYLNMFKEKDLKKAICASACSSNQPCIFKAFRVGI